MDVCLRKMTKELCCQYYQNFEMDPALYMDTDQFQPYVYSEEKCDAVLDRHRKLGRIYLAVMLDEEPIGEIILKRIDREKMHCTMGICMRSDAYKNKGYGTQAEILAVKYAFNELGMETVYADAIRKNTRSQHVLKKVGFVQIYQDDTFYYYLCDKSNWNPHKLVIYQDKIL